jgi:L-galactose dehydrogenase
MLYRKLGKTGWKVSVLSLGGSSVGGAFGPVAEKEGIRAIRTAVDLGINFIETAPYYGSSKSEDVLGKALKELPRQSFYLASHVGRSGPGQKDFDFSPEGVARGVDESLQRLRLAHIDLILVQDLEFAPVKQIVEETLPALKKLRQQGKIHKIGVTAYPLKALRNLLDQAGVDAVLSYGHYTLNDITLVQMFPYLLDKGVGVINAAPLGMGLLTPKGPPKWHPAPAQIRDQCAKAVAMCAKKKANLPRLAIQFAASHKSIATTLIGAGSAKTIKENIRSIEKPLDLELLAEVTEMLRPIQNKSWTSGRKENN